MNKVRIDLIGSEDGALLDVIEIDQTLFYFGQMKASGYGITLTEYLEFCFCGLQQLRLNELKDYLSMLAADSRMQSDTCFWFGSGQNDPILSCFYDWGMIAQ